MYLQRADKVNEGDEFEFEHHLVTVEEFVGRMVQDLAAIISPIVERRQVKISDHSTEFLADLGQQRQLQAVHQQHPLYPERGVRIETPGQDTPLPARAMLLQPFSSVGGFGEAAHVSLTELLKRSGAQQHSTSSITRTPRDASVGNLRRKALLATPGSNVEGETIPISVKPATNLRPYVRREQVFVTPARSSHQPKEVMHVPPPKYDQPTNYGAGSRTIFSPHSLNEICSTGGIYETPLKKDKPSAVRRTSTSGPHLKAQATGRTVSEGIIVQAQPLDMFPVIHPSQFSSPLTSRTHQSNGRVPFNPPSRTIQALPANRTKPRAPSPQAPSIQIEENNQWEEELTVSSRQEACERPTFITARAVALNASEHDGEHDADLHLDDAPPLSSPEVNKTISNSRKRASENLPTTTIKLGTTKRKMLLCKKPVEGGRSNGSSRLTTNDRRRAAGSGAMARHQSSLSDTDFGVRLGQSHKPKPNIPAAGRDTPTSKGDNPAVDEIVTYGWGGDGDDSDGLSQEISRNRPLVEVNKESSALEINLIFSPPSSVHQNSGKRASAAVASIGSKNQKKKGKGKAKEATKAGRTQVITTNDDNSLDQADASLGSKEGVASNTKPVSPPMPPLKGRKRNAREHICNEEASIQEIERTHDQTEFGPWSKEAYDLFEWRPPPMTK